MTAPSYDRDDVIAQAVDVANAAEYQRQEAEDYIGNVADIIARQTYYIEQAIEKGLPPEVAHASAAQMAGVFFAPSFQAYHRSEYR